MARPSERRAALRAMAPTASEASIRTLTEQPVFGIDNIEPVTPDDQEEPPMKVQFAHVHLDREIPRFGDKGLASSSSTFFKAAEGVTIELDTALGIVRLQKGAMVVNIPREKIASFGEILAPVASVKADSAA